MVKKRKYSGDILMMGTVFAAVTRPDVINRNALRQRRENDLVTVAQHPSWCHSANEPFQTSVE